MEMREGREGAALEAEPAGKGCANIRSPQRRHAITCSKPVGYGYERRQDNNKKVISKLSHFRASDFSAAGKSFVIWIDFCDSASTL